jgi:origin recognition complex subunit 6
MCREAGKMAVAPTILAGIETIVAPGGRRTRDEWVRENLTLLLAVIYFYVMQQVKRIQDGAMVDKKSYIPARKEIISLLTRVRDEVHAKGMDEEDFWDGWKGDIRAKEFDVAIQIVLTNKWLDSDWFHGIREVLSREEANDQEEEEEDDYGEDMEGEDGSDGREPGSKMQVRRADTMFQERYDFLSDARQEDYRIWKEGILKRIDDLERNQPELMNVDTW